MTQAYDNQEIDRALTRAREVSRASLTDRKAARAAFAAAAADDPALVGERLSWLLGGSYGYGEMLLARRVLANTRMNRAAALCQMIACWEWMCPDNFARDAWKSLTERQRTKLSREIAKAMCHAEAALADGTAA